jgi:hypothetical protein
MGDRKTSISRNAVGELYAKQTALERVKASASATAGSSKDEKDRALLRKRGSTGEAPQSPTPPLPGKGPGLVQGRSVLEQIGTPDFNGWLMKKGENYNTWKNRYCVLKGHNLYWMRSNNATVRIVFCYFFPLHQVLTCDFRRPRLRGISTFLVTRSSPMRISSQEALVSEWSTPATRLICSIPTPSPSSGNG